MPIANLLLSLPCGAAIRAFNVVPWHKAAHATFAPAGECPGGCSSDASGEKFACDKGALVANPKQVTVARPKKGK
jgi:hypothetical protein